MSTKKKSASKRKSTGQKAKQTTTKKRALSMRQTESLQSRALDRSKVTSDLVNAWTGLSGGRRVLLKDAAYALRENQANPARGVKPRRLRRAVKPPTAERVAQGKKNSKYLETYREEEAKKKTRGIKREDQARRVGNQARRLSNQRKSL